MPDRIAMTLARRLVTHGVLATLLAGSHTLTAQAQGLGCSNDGRSAPTALLERFMDADCTACWANAQAPQAPRGALLLDWVLPSAKGDDAAMSTVALPEALERLQTLGLHMSEPTPSRLTRRYGSRPAALRVVLGFPYNGYLGAMLSHQPQHAQPYTAWLLLVEQLPAGTEGSPVARQLVRAAAELRPGTVRGRPAALRETRAFRLPEGALPERLQVVGWVQDAQGRVMGLAQSHCPTQQ